jgi:hypothetical protein
VAVIVAGSSVVVAALRIEAPAVGIGKVDRNQDGNDSPEKILPM